MIDRPKCIVKEENNRKSCTSRAKMEIKVTLYHPGSERKSQQHWFLCEKHMRLFLDAKGEGWYVRYNNKENISPVIDYSIIFDIEQIANIPNMIRDKTHKEEKIFLNI